MNARNFCRLAQRILRHPTVPYHEHGVRAEIERVCEENRLDCRRDDYGNLLVKYAAGPKERPVVLAAHMDHPGFEIVQALSPRSWRARFCGSVGAEYFRAGVPLRLWPGGERARLAGPEAGEKEYQVHAKVRPEQEPEFATWDLTDFELRAGRIYARACDDLIGVSAALATLIEMRRRGLKGQVIAAITRAEEVGFHGALALAASGTLPRDGLVISLETSRELPGAKMGEGVVLRVGDRASIFNSEATRYLAETAAEIQTPGFRWQRALMSGGTCEATAYQEAGFLSAAVCVPLGNYHNCGPGAKVRAEYVDTEDCLNMVQLLTEAASGTGRYQELTDRLRARLGRLRAEALQRLRGTAG